MKDNSTIDPICPTCKNLQGPIQESLDCLYDECVAKGKKIISLRESLKLAIEALEEATDIIDRENPSEGDFLLRKSKITGNFNEVDIEEYLTEVQDLIATIKARVEL